MHIGFDAKRFFHNFTGLGNYARSTIYGLVTQFPEHQYILYSAQASDMEKLAPWASRVIVQKACPWGQYFPTLWRTLAIPQVAKKDHLHIFHGLSHELPLTAFAPSTATIVTIHDLLFLTHSHLYPWIDRQIYTIKYKKSCQRADLVLAISEKTAEDVHALFSIPREKIRVVYQSYAPAFNQIVDDQTQQNLRQKYSLPKEYILFVGSLTKRKGVQFLIQALALLPRDHRPALVMVGSGPLETALRQNMVTLGLEAELHFLGRVPDEDLPGLYQGAEVFVYPSLAEGFGIPIVEALASQVPVITSTGSCFSEPGGPAALYTTPGDITALAQALEQVLGDQDLQQSMIARGQEHVQKFHWQQTSQQLMNTYTELSPP